MSQPTHQTGFGFARGEKKIHRYDNLVVKQPKPMQVLLKVEAAGLCSSDLHMLWGQDKRIPDKFIMGHEIAGQIVSVGSALVNHPVYKVGGRFAVTIPDSCGSCKSCRLGNDNMCSGKMGSAYGLSQDGGFQQYLVVSNLRTLLPIPDKVSYVEAAVASDAVLTPYSAIQKAKQFLNPGDRVLLFGLGGLGANALQILKSYGFYVVACDLKPEAKELAQKFGADEFYNDINTSKHRPETFLACFDFVGFQPTFDGCQKYVSERGVIVIVGLGRARLQMKNYELARREIKVFFSFGGNSQQQIECMQWVAEGKVKPVANLVPIKELPAYFDKLEKGQIQGRIVFDPAKL